MTEPEQNSQPAPDMPPDLAELGEIIRAYSAAAAELQQSHQLLQKQVQELSGELRKKNDELSLTVDQVSSLKNYLASIINSSADGIIAINMERRIMAWNPAASMLTEIDPDIPQNPDGMFILNAMPGPCREMGLMLMESLQENRKISGVEMRLTDRLGNTRVLSVSASPVMNLEDRAETKSHIGAVQIFSELTAIRELEDRANRQDRLAALGEMAAGVAHEIRNPLGGIELYASSLGRKFAEDSSERATCQKIIAAAASLNRIVTDMLTFTRGRSAQPRPTPVRQVVRPALDLAAGELATREIETTVEIDNEERRYPLDPEQLSQAALNVILNAAQAIGKNGTIRISAKCEQISPDNSDLVISFADDGPGIPDEAKAKIFDPFFTLRKDGTGLGLAIVNKIVGDHSGIIDVKDNKPRGTIVSFRIPVGK
jgi:Signal transduction histidine kinase involved in nitrogen fixation and metabolism regulation